jgi:hypothetical protein
VLEDLPRPVPGLALRVLGLALLLLVLTGVCFFAVAQEPFWCPVSRDVLDLLALPGVIAGGWLGLFILAIRSRSERGMGGTLALLPLLAAPSLFVAITCMHAYMDDLGRSPVQHCAEMPDYGSCAAGGPVSG